MQTKYFIITFNDFKSILSFSNDRNKLENTEATCSLKSLQRRSILSLRVDDPHTQIHLLIPLFSVIFIQQVENIFITIK